MVRVALITPASLSEYNERKTNRSISSLSRGNRNGKLISSGGNLAAENMAVSRRAVVARMMYGSRAKTRMKPMTSTDHRFRHLDYCAFVTGDGLLQRAWVVTCTHMKTVPAGRSTSQTEIAPV